MNLKGSDFNFTKSSFSAKNKEPFFFHQVLPFVMWGSRKHLEDPFGTMESDTVYAPPPPIFCLLVRAQASVHFLLTLYQSFPSTMNRLLWASCSRKWGHMWDDPPPFRHVYCDRKKEKKNPRKHVNNLRKKITSKVKRREKELKRGCEWSGMV